MNQVIVIGGGLSGLSAAHTLLERGSSVLLLEKNPFMGGNSTKATSGINGATTRTQVRDKVGDSEEAFLRDTVLSATKGESDEPYPLARVLVAESAPAVHWLQDAFKIDLSILGRLGGHSFPRTHRGKEKFPGMVITFALMERYQEIAEKQPDRAKLVLRARATRLLQDASGAVCGVEYEAGGETHTAHGPVVIATGGYGADFSDDSILIKARPDLKGMPTTNGPHSTGDGIKLALAAGGATKDIEYVQVHPTGLVMPKDPDNPVKFLAAEALRGAGGVILDANGKRFCNELGRRDYVSGEMGKNKGPFRLLLNGAASKQIHWHCVHYHKRGLFSFYESGRDLAKEMGVDAAVLKRTFDAYNRSAEQKSDEFGKKFFANAPLSVDDKYYVGIVTPVVHYTMGGIATSPASEVLKADGSVVPGLYVTGEAMGGTHGKNRLGGSSLLDCVVFGRVAGASCASYQLGALAKQRAARRAGGLVEQLGGDGSTIRMAINPSQGSFTLQVSFDGQQGGAGAGPAQQASGGAAPSAAAAAPAKKKEEPKQEMKEYTMDEVAKHNTEGDCWVVVNGLVLNVTKFMPDHPGGKQAIMLFAGKDATEEFEMLHEYSVIDKYAAYTKIGTLKK